MSMMQGASGLSYSIRGRRQRSVPRGFDLKRLSRPLGIRPLPQITSSDLDISILGQLPAAELTLNDHLEPVL